MAEHELAIAVNSSVAIVGLVAWWLWLHNDYVLDKFRQDLFALRDELFDYAESGAVSFQNPAYAELRQLFNRVIQYAHRLTFWQMIGFLVIESVSDEDRQAALSFHREWRSAVTSIADQKVREKLLEFHNKLNVLIVWKILKTSLAAMAILLISLVLHMGRSSLQLANRLFRTEYLQERAWRHAS